MRLEKLAELFCGDAESDGFSSSTPEPWKKGHIIAICTGAIPSKRIKGTRWIVEYRVDGVSWEICERVSGKYTSMDGEIRL
jgi:hypothetical protein